MVKRSYPIRFDHTLSLLLRHGRKMSPVSGMTKKCVLSWLAVLLFACRASAGGGVSGAEDAVVACDRHIGQTVVDILLGAAAVVSLASVAWLYRYFRRYSRFMRRRIDLAMTIARRTACDTASLKKHIEDIPSRSIVDNMRSIIASSQIELARKSDYLAHLDLMDRGQVETLCASAVANLTATDRKYIICFLLRMSTADMAQIFNVEPETIYIVKYRIKRKFAGGAPLPF